MASFFAQRAYPLSVVNRALERATTVARQEALRSDSSSPPEQQTIPLVLTYHPNNEKVINIINKNWDLLKCDSDTRDVFRSTRILCAYRHDSNLRDSLVRSSLPTTEPRDEEAGTFPCGWPRCFTCPHTNASRTIKTPGGQLTMRHRYTLRQAI